MFCKYKYLHVKIVSLATSKELREFYVRVTEHRHRLRKVATELKLWEKALVEHEVELQQRIDQMDELEEKFLGEAKDCREQLGKS